MESPDRRGSIHFDGWEGKFKVLSRGIKIGGLLALVVIVSVAVLTASRWPFTRASIVGALQKKFSSTVEVKTFHETYFTPGFVAEGVTFRRNGDPGVPPIATIEKLTIQGAYWEFFSSLIGTTSRVRQVRIEGLHIFASPGSERIGNAAQPAGDPKQSALIIDQIIADGAVLEFASSDPGTEPLKFEIHELTLNSVADDRPLSFHVALQNPKPPGEIRADGHFGPLQAQNAGQTPLSAAYTFQGVNLGVFPGIGGTLASAGKFNGVLERIEIEGSTDTPDFEVTRSGHTVPLKTQFQGIVNGMNGDVFLQSVRAQLERTSLVSHVEVAKKADSEGKSISVDATEQQGRIQDWLRLLAKADPPAFTGAMNFRVQVQVPPGKGSFLERVNLLGDFGIDAASFKPTTQEKVDNLSQLAQGEKKNDDPASVVENLNGHVVMNHAIATFSTLSFSVPGAKAHVHGTYGLLTEQLNLHGTLQVDNKLSKGTTGVKSVLLKSVEPFFKKKKTGEIVPIKIGGTFSHPSFGLDVKP